MTTYDSTTTLAEIRAARPCGIKPADEGGWAKLLRTRGEPHKNPNLERQVTIRQILDSNGLDDAAWCLRVPSLERLSRHFGAWCADQVLHLFEAEFPDDLRPRQAIAVARDDDATPEQRAAARAAAWDAVAAARSTAGAAAGAAARSAAEAAAEAAEAAWDAVAAARSTAWAAAGAAAGAAAWAAAEAAEAAWGAARANQERHLRKMLAGEA